MIQIYDKSYMINIIEDFNDNFVLIVTPCLLEFKLNNMYITLYQVCINNPMICI